MDESAFFQFVDDLLVEMGDGLAMDCAADDWFTGVLTSAYG